MKLLNHTICTLVTNLYQSLCIDSVGTSHLFESIYMLSNAKYTSMYTTVIQLNDMALISCPSVLAFPITHLIYDQFL